MLSLRHRTTMLSRTALCTTILIGNWVGGQIELLSVHPYAVPIFITQRLESFADFSMYLDCHGFPDIFCTGKVRVCYGKWRLACGLRPLLGRQILLLDRG